MWPTDITRILGTRTRSREINDELQNVIQVPHFNVHCSFVERTAPLFWPNEFYVPWKWWILLHLFLVSTCILNYEVESTIQIMFTLKIHAKHSVIFIPYTSLSLCVHFLSNWFENNGFKLFVRWQSSHEVWTHQTFTRNTLHVFYLLSFFFFLLVNIGCYFFTWMHLIKTTVARQSFMISIVFGPILSILFLCCYWRWSSFEMFSRFFEHAVSMNYWHKWIRYGMRNV